jgi:hypothetical protein
MARQVLRKIWVENKIPGDWYKGVIIPFTRMEILNSVETTEELHCFAKHSKSMKGY